jgi:hypothetical protein
VIEKAIAFRDNLTLAELERAAAGTPLKFARLCHHWAQLAERRPEAKKWGAQRVQQHALFQAGRNRALRFRWLPRQVLSGPRTACSGARYLGS